MGNVLEPPDEVIAIGYTWQKGNSSGGTREVFVSMVEAKQRLNDLIIANTIKDRRVAVFQLLAGKWSPVEIQWPESLRLV